jgi:hypothetical protein
VEFPPLVLSTVVVHPIVWDVNSLGRVGQRTLAITPHVSVRRDRRDGYADRGSFGILVCHKPAIER